MKKYFVLFTLTFLTFTFASCEFYTEKNQDENQDKTLFLVSYNQQIEISSGFENLSDSFSFQWYESFDKTNLSGTLLEGETNSSFLVPATNQKGIRYYYCTAKIGNSLNKSQSSKTQSSTQSSEKISKLKKVVCTGLPQVYINTPNNSKITSKTEWIKNAKISVQGSENQDWNFDEVSTSIKGRGNTTWNWPKKAYALKLNKKQKILGFPKSKRWVLIANYLDNSFLRNEMAFYLSETFNLDWTCHGEFVDLILNGEYKGLYWFGEAIKVDENRVNIDENNDFLIEMDTYFDETWKFKSQIKNLPYQVKNDDSMNDSRLENLKEKIYSLEKLLYPNFSDDINASDCSAPDEVYSEILDIDSWAKYYFVNEIMSNRELGWPKSCYFTFDTANNIFKAGPVWDFDWVYQDLTCVLQDTLYYDALFKSPSFTSRAKNLWQEYYSLIDIDGQIETLREKISVASEFDTLIWGKHKDPSEVVREDFDAYVDFLKETLNKKLLVVNDAIMAL